MDQKTVTTHEVILAGIGGKGVLLIGQMLARVALRQDKHVSYYPTYYAAVRGGGVDCTVIFSDALIASPLLNEVGAVVIFEPSQLGSYLDRVKSGGLLIIEKEGFSEKIERNDITIIEVPAVEMAVKAGDIRMANFVLMGAYISATSAFPPESVNDEITAKFIGREKQIEASAAAFRYGIDATNNRH